MRKTSKFVSMLLCLLMSFFIVGCGGNSGTNSNIIGGNESYDGEKTQIEIWLWESGVGKEYMEKIAGAFVKKNPQYYITIEATADSSFMDNKLPLNAELNTADILMSIKPSHSAIKAYAVPLNDLLESKVDGETKTILEKIGKGNADIIRYSDEKYYYLPYNHGLGGLCYNADIMADYYIPKTTDQLIELVDELVADKKVPFMHFIDGGYWNYLYQVWAAQYAGVEKYHDVYENPTLEKVTADDNGFYEALKVLEQCLNSGKKYYNGSNAQSHTDAQTLFLEGYSVMMVSGSWMEYEMSNNYKPGEKNFRMMRTPVISSVVDRCTTIADDEELSCLIDAIDNGETALEGTGYNVNQTDFDTVKEARMLFYDNAIGHAALIPNYSDNITGAKAFLKFMYSDEAIKIYEDTLKIPHVANYDKKDVIDTSNWNVWQKEQYNYGKTSTPYCESTNAISELYTTGGLTINGKISVVAKLSTTNDADRLTATQLWNSIKGYNRDNWDTYVANVG